MYRAPTQIIPQLDGGIFSCRRGEGTVRAYLGRGLRGGRLCEIRLVLLRLV